MFLAVDCLNCYVCLLVLRYLTAVHAIDTNTRIMVDRVKGGDIVTLTNPDMNCSERKCSRCNTEHYIDGSECLTYSSNCSFRCKPNTPTFLPQERKCVNSSHILGTLTVLRKTKDHLGCKHWLSIKYNEPEGYTRAMRDVINLGSNGNVNLQFNKSRSIPKHYNCSLSKQNSSYLASKGDWLKIEESHLNQYKFDIAIANDGLMTIQWAALSDDNLLSGKVLNLKLRCSNIEKQNWSKDFCITFKTKGNVTVIASAARPTTTSYPGQGTRISTTGDSGTGGKAMSSRNVVITIVVLLIVVVLLAPSVVVFVRRRKTTRKLTLESENVELNPTYEKGPDASIVVQDPESPKKRKKVKEETNNYQPLVQNTVFKDASALKPVYQSLVKDESTTSHPQNEGEMYSVPECDLGNGQKDSNCNHNTIQSNGSSHYCQPYSYNTIAGLSKPPPLYHVLEGPAEECNAGQELYRQDPVYRVLERP